MADDNSEHVYSNGLVAYGEQENVYDALQDTIADVINNEQGFVLITPKTCEGVDGIAILTTSDAAGTLAVLRNALDMMKITES